jgi:hypothetical protein
MNFSIFEKDPSMAHELFLEHNLTPTWPMNFLFLGVAWSHEFLGIVSHTNDTLVDKLQDDFRENKDRIIDDDEIDFDPKDYGKGCCLKCHLKIYEKVVLSCGHSSTCKYCAEKLLKSDQPICPNLTCRELITGKTDLLD